MPSLKEPQGPCFSFPFLFLSWVTENGLIFLKLVVSSIVYGLCSRKLRTLEAVHHTVQAPFSRVPPALALWPYFSAIWYEFKEQIHILTNLTLKNRSYIYLLTESWVVFGKMSALCLSFSCTAWPPVVLMVAGLFYGFSIPVRATAGACEEPTSDICPGLCHLSSLFVSCGIFVSCYCYCGWCLVFLRQGSG